MNVMPGRIWNTRHVLTLWCALVATTVLPQWLYAQTQRPVRIRDFQRSAVVSAESTWTYCSFNNADVRMDGNRLSIRFDWQIYAVKNSSEVDQIFLCTNGRVLDLIYDGIPGRAPGATGTYSKTLQTTQTDPPGEFPIYIVRVAATSAIRGKEHFEQENGGWSALLCILDDTPQSTGTRRDTSGNSYYSDIRECISQGYLKIDSIRGMSDQKPNCGMAIAMRVRSVVAWDIRTVVVRGQILDSRNSAVQDMIVGESTNLNVSARSTEEIGLNVFCMEVNDDPPGTNDYYDLGPHLQNGHSHYVNINIANHSSLMNLPGIGPVLAGRIIDHRNRKGFFSSVEDIMQVTGIGPKSFERLKPYITTDGGIVQNDLDDLGLANQDIQDLSQILSVVDTQNLQGNGAAQNAVWTVTDDLNEQNLLEKTFGAAALIDGAGFDDMARQTQSILDQANVDRQFDLPNLNSSNYLEAMAEKWLPGIIGGIVIGFFVFLIIVAALHAKKKKSAFACYFLWLFFGGLGFHKFYLRKTALGFLYIITGGIFLLGLLVDLFTIPGQVRKFNQQFVATDTKEG